MAVLSRMMVALFLCSLSFHTFSQEISEKEVHDYDPNALTPSEAALELREHASKTHFFRTVDLTQYDHLDPKKIVPKKLLEEALIYFDSNLEKIPNKDLLIVVDFKAHSSKKRQFVVDLRSGDVTPMLVTHGKNSDTDNDGYATKFSNTVDSKQSSLGFYLTAESYFGKYGYSLRLDGLSTTNSKARERAIVIHPADYVVDNGKKIGRSYGCLAVDPKLSETYISLVKEGTLIYAGLGN